MKPRGPRSSPSTSPSTLPFPFDLRAARLQAKGKEWAVLSFAAGSNRAKADALTPAERAVLEGLLAGQSNAAIARARGTSIRTVANQVAALMRKLGLDSRRELIARFASSP